MNAKRLIGTILSEVLFMVAITACLFGGWYFTIYPIQTGSQQAAAASVIEHEWDGFDKSKLITDPETGVPYMTDAQLKDNTMRMFVPKFGSDWQRSIRYGVSSDILDSETAGVGIYPEASPPGKAGNFSVAGHDTGWGNTFIDLFNLQPGDRAYIQSPAGIYVYTFRNHEYIQPDQIEVLAMVPGDKEQKLTPKESVFTITTCNPPYAAQERVAAYFYLESFIPSGEKGPAEVAHLLEGGKA